MMPDPASGVNRRWGLLSAPALIASHQGDRLLLFVAGRWRFDLQW